MNPRTLSRRTLLGGAGGLLANAALAQLFGPEPANAAPPRAHPPGHAGGLDVVPRAKRVIYLFQAGGPSQIDLFDHKPMLKDWHAKDLPKSVMGDAKFTGMVNGQSSFPVVASPWAFARHGGCGAWVSELFPEFAKVVDDICFIKSVTSTQVDHDAAITYIQTGHQIAGRPTIGAWAAYGLGSDGDDLPAFVALRTAKGGSFLIDRHWGAGFPAVQVPGGSGRRHR